ncbi:MAG TPA: signal peptidase I, partial [Planctomycetota bacterium]|nr:signal peptidase I [Planctomycetota bacterium]
TSGILRVALRRAATCALWVFVYKLCAVDVVGVLTGSMEPTVIGRPERGDQVLMDRLAYVFDAPERFDAVFFRFPQNRAVTYLKRIVGLPGEQIVLKDGDLWLGDPDWFGDVDEGVARGKIRRLRKPEALQRALFDRFTVAEAPKDAPFDFARFDRLFDAPPATRARWTETADGALRGDGDEPPDRLPWARLKRPLTDFLPDPLAPAADPAAPAPGTGGAYSVGDAAFEALVRLPRGGAVHFRLDDPRTGERRTARFARDADGRGTATLTDASGGATAAAGPLPADGWARVRFEAVDGALRAFVDDVLVASAEAPGKAATSPPAGGVFLAATGGAEVRAPRVCRDLYWIPDGQTRFFVPSGAYLCLGDHPSESSDARLWRVTVVEETATGRRFEGDADGVRPGAARADGRNPRSHDDGSVEFVDRDNVRRVYSGDRELFTLGSYRAPYIPREALLGRAVAVVWPPERAGFVR